MMVLFLLAIIIFIFVWLAGYSNSPEQREIREKARQARTKFLLDNPDTNTNDWELHKKRMIKSGMSQFKGCHYYVGPRGGWYYINSNGRKTYV